MGAEEAQATAVVAVLLLRLIWTVADVGAAGACYWLPVGGVKSLARQGIAS